MNDLSRLAKDADAAASGRVAAERQAYMSLPRPGVSLPSSLRESVRNLVNTPNALRRSPPSALSGHTSSSSSSASSEAPLPARSFESQTVSHTFYSSVESLNSSTPADASSSANVSSTVAKESAAGDTVVLRQRGGRGAYGTSEGGTGDAEAVKKDASNFEYRMSVILDELQQTNL